MQRWWQDYIQDVKIKILNQQLIIVSILVVFFTIQAFVLRDKDWWISASILLICLFLYWLNNRGLFKIARFVWITVFPVLVLGITYLYGESLSGEYVYLGFIVSALVFYENNWIRVGQISLSIFLFCLTRYIYQNIESPLSAFVYSGNDILVFIVSVVCASIVMITFFNETLKHYEAQANLSHELKEQNANLIQSIEERRITNEKLEENQIQLQKSNDQLVQYSYVASHDLKTPIRSVSNFVDLLTRRLQENEDPEIHEYLSFIKSGTKKMYYQVEGLLETSQYRHIELHLQEVEINELLAQVQNNLKPLIDRVNGIIRYQTLPTIKGDPMHLERLFQNLLENGLKYNSSERPTVSIVHRKIEASHEFSITDNGIGIAPEYHQTIFQIFKRLHLPGEYDGNGIGLANCKHIVELHEGKIWVGPSAGPGTTFRFTLPA